MSAHEVGQLFKLVRDLRDQGVAILFVSHRLEEVFEIADKVTVFRDGRLISTVPRAEATPRRAIADMVGREMGLLAEAAPGAAGRDAPVGAEPLPATASSRTSASTFAAARFSASPA